MVDLMAGQPQALPMPCSHTALSGPGEMAKPAMIGPKILMQVILRVRPVLALRLVEQRLAIFGVADAPATSSRRVPSQEATGQPAHLLCCAYLSTLTASGQLGIGPGSLGRGMSFAVWVLAQSLGATDGSDLAFEGLCSGEGCRGVEAERGNQSLHRLLARAAWCRYLLRTLMRQPEACTPLFRCEVNFFLEALKAARDASAGTLSAHQPPSSFPSAHLRPAASFCAGRAR